MKALFLALLIPFVLTQYYEWTWMHGITGGVVDPVWGTINVLTSTNDPGNRYGALSWTAADNTLYLYGGCKFDIQGCKINLLNYIQLATVTFGQFLLL